MPEHDISAAAITAGVERAITKLLSAPDLDGAFYDAVRQGTRDAIWAIAAQSSLEMPPGHMN
jgi:hypothetical protein